MDIKPLLTFTVIIIMSMLNICAWNMRSATYAAPYINELCSQYDVVFGAEHRLYEHELHIELNAMFPNYITYGKASNDLNQETSGTSPGHCGVCLAWRQDLNRCIRRISIDSDRIIAIQCNNIGKNGACITIIGEIGRAHV